MADQKVTQPKAGLPPVDPNYTKNRIAAQNARKEAIKKGGSLPGTVKS